MSQSATESNHVMVAVMGATGTGKSAFIRHLTNDPKIIVSGSINSETPEIQTSCYVDAKTGRSITLIDTPGFDDSHGRFTDTDILQSIIDFLNPEEGEGKKLNGIIYMHRITDNRMGGMARKNLRMFETLCGEKSFRHVCVVTTHWDNDDGMGPARESEMKKGPLKSLLASGAQMCRHWNTAQSAQAIMAGLIPLSEVTTQIQEEVTRDIPLGETRAGRILDEYIKESEKNHQEELAELRMELKQAVQDQKPTAELEAEGKMLEEKLMRTEEDQNRLAMTMPQLREQQKKVKEVMEKLQAAIAQKAEEVREARNASPNRVEKLEEELAELKRQNEKAEYYVKLGLYQRLLKLWDTITRLVTSWIKWLLYRG